MRETTEPRRRDSGWGQFKVPVTLQGAFGQPNWFVDQAFALALGDRLAKGVETDALIREASKSGESRLDIRFIDTVAEGSGE